MYFTGLYFQNYFFMYTAILERNIYFPSHLFWRVASVMNQLKEVTLDLCFGKYFFKAAISSRFNIHQ